MDCSVARQLLVFRRVGGPSELAPEDVADLDRHLANCPHCAAAVHRQDAFDTAVAGVMKGTTVPSGLRDKLLTDALAKQGARLRQKIYSHAAVAAAVFLGVALAPGIVSRLFRPTLDTDAVATNQEREMETPEQAVTAWLKSEGLPAELPYDFDYRLNDFHGKGLLEGKEVPLIVFKVARPNESRQDFARVYIVRDSQFDTSNIKNTSSSFVTVTVERRDRFTYVIVHTAPLDVFLKPPRLGA